MSDRAELTEEKNSSSSFSCPHGPLCNKKKLKESCLVVGFSIFFFFCLSFLYLSTCNCWGLRPARPVFGKSALSLA